MNARQNAEKIDEQDKMGLLGTIDLTGPDTLVLSSPDIDHEGTQFPLWHAGKGIGGQEFVARVDLAARAQGYDSVVAGNRKDPDAPTPAPFIHCVLFWIPRDRPCPRALNAADSDDGRPSTAVSMGRGYLASTDQRKHGPASVCIPAFRPCTPMNQG